MDLVQNNCDEIGPGRFSGTRNFRFSSEVIVRLFN